MVPSAEVGLSSSAALDGPAVALVVVELVVVVLAVAAGFLPFFVTAGAAWSALLAAMTVVPGLAALVTERLGLEAYDVGERTAVNLTVLAFFEGAGVLLPSLSFPEGSVASAFLFGGIVSQTKRGSV